MSPATSITPLFESVKTFSKRTQCSALQLFLSQKSHRERWLFSSGPNATQFGPARLETSGQRVTNCSSSSDESHRINRGDRYPARPCWQAPEHSQQPHL